MAKASKKVTTKSPTRAPRVKPYVSKDGSYIDIDNAADGYRIIWVCPVEDSAGDFDFGMYIGEEFEGRDLKVPPKDLDTWENWVPYQTAKALTDPDSVNKFGAFIYNTEAAAKKVLRAINEALNNTSFEAPWPDWAIKAKAEGWAPPTGWKP